MGLLNAINELDSFVTDKTTTRSKKNNNNNLLLLNALNEIEKKDKGE